jgi:transaldolase
MKATQLIHNLGQSIWLDNLTRDMLDSGTLQRYLDELSVTGVTSNPTIFERAIKNSAAYDQAFSSQSTDSSEEVFFDLALEDVSRAAHALLPIHEISNGVDGWVSLEVSPELAHNTEATIRAATRLFAAANCRNLFIKVPGTAAGLLAVEELIFAGVPVNVTLLFSREQYMSAAIAFLRGIERRLEAGLNPNVASVASVFVSRWDAAVDNRVSARLRNQLGIAMAKRTYRAARALLSSASWQRVYNAGARPQRLLWASTGTKDPTVAPILYVKSLVAPYTINTMPESTLKALARLSQLNSILPYDGGDCEEVLAQFVASGIDLDALAARLQVEGVASFLKSWKELLAVIASRRELQKMTVLAANG